jgi:hypothetical protein
MGREDNTSYDEDTEEVVKVTWPEIISDVLSGLGWLLALTIFLVALNYKEMLHTWREINPLPPCVNPPVQRIMNNQNPPEPSAPDQNPSNKK